MKYKIIHAKISSIGLKSHLLVKDKPFLLLYCIINMSIKWALKKKHVNQMMYSEQGRFTNLNITKNFKQPLWIRTTIQERFCDGHIMVDLELQICDIRCKKNKFHRTTISSPKVKEETPLTQAGNCPIQRQCTTISSTIPNEQFPCSQAKLLF